MDSTPPKPPRLRSKTPVTPPPPPPPAEPVAAAAPEPAPESQSPAQPKRPLSAHPIFQHRLFRLGGEGLAASLFIHGLLLFVATIWVVSVATNHKQEPNSFATGAGGGHGGERAIAQKTKAKPNAPKSLTKSATKLTSKNANSSIALPEMPDLSRAALGAMTTSSKGFGGGAGGAVGIGKGGKNFTGRSVMGMKISAAHIAVYFDNSPSMEPYLSGVEKQIKEQFPSADVFRYFGIFNLNQDGEVVGGKPNQKYAIETVEQIAANRSGGRKAAANDPAKFSPGGRNLLNGKDAQFRAGGVGAWIDGMLAQKQYDAIVVFSDFEDGIQQYRTKGETTPRLVFDSDLRPPSDSRTDAEKAWEERWVKTFALALEHKAPRLYIYSTSKEPQELYQRCVTASGGEFKMVTLPRGGIFGDPKKGKK